ncbi:MAG: MtrB/PioB family decaheme-associated outer membrane protein [Xanthomonadales bacterium]|nr:MtrB/PioB family decaheme-associated outer membrane protein [Xanthomonadales bacterium]
MRCIHIFATVLLLVSGSHAAMAQETDTWQCNFCTYASGWFGSLTLGAGWASEAPTRFVDYRGINNSGLFPSLGGALAYRNGRGHWLEFEAHDLGTERRMLKARGGLEGKYQLRIAYREIAKLRGFNSSTPFTGPGSPTLTLPANWVNASQTSGFTALNSALSPLALQTVRKNFSTGLDLKLPGAWSLKADYRHFQKDGTRPFAAGVLTLNSSHVPAPVNFNNDRVDLAASWSADHKHLRIGFTSSVFNNQNAAITIQNPFAPLGSTHFLRSALEPDSEFRQLTLSGAFRPADGIKISGSASRGSIRQDGALLPYSINPDFENIPLPREQLAQKIDSDSLRLASRLSARLGPRLDLTASIRIDERDNRTPVDLYTPVITDLAIRPETPNRPYSFERKHYRAELAWRVPGSLRLRAGLGRREHQRSLQSVRKTEDDSLWFEAGFNGWSSAQLRLRLENTNRDASPYLSVNDPGLQENPLMRKFNLAAMDRRRAIFELDIAPALPLSASLSWHVSDNDYEASLLGLQYSRDESFNFDLAYNPTKDWSIYGFASLEDIDSRIAGAGISAWRANTADQFTTLGAGFAGQISETLELDLELVSAESKGNIRTTGGNKEAPFPSIRTRLRNARIRATYAHGDHWNWILSAEQESYSSSDWQVDGLGTDGIPAILAFGQDSPDYHVTVLRIEALYRF